MTVHPYIVSGTRLSLKIEGSLFSKRHMRATTSFYTHVNERVGPEQLGQSSSLDLVNHGRLQVRLNGSRHVFVLATSDFLEVHREPFELLILVTASLDVLSRLV